MWFQKEIQLKPRPRGFHLITFEILDKIDEMGKIKTGLCHLFIQHSSASLTINENADPSVRRDFARVFDRLVPENQPYYEHRDEGPDDMPAHIKSSLLGASLSIPVANGRLNLGVWQGIYLCEHRNRAGVRHLIVTLQGE